MVIMLPQNLSEDEKLDIELAGLRSKFPQKTFQLVGEPGSRRIEVVLQW